MAIFQLFEQEVEWSLSEESKGESPVSLGEKKATSSFISSFLTRGCFLLLLCLALPWVVTELALFVISSLLHVGSFARSSILKKNWHRRYLKVRRSAISTLSLLIGLFSPSFAVMVACTYFLMYDKEGMERIVPVSLQGQFRSLFNEHKL